MKQLLLLPLMLLVCSAAYSFEDSTLLRYERAYQQLDSLAKADGSQSFKRAVFLVENTYFNNRLPFEKFEGYIKELTSLAGDWMLFNHLKDYRYDDSLQVLRNLAIYKVLKDTIKIFTSQKEGLAHVPYQYSFEDYKGYKDWSNMFVTKLMAIHEGNCHSLPYLYKILADDIGATCWLGLAPNHMYIKNRCKSFGWYNTELTNASFPIDAWIMASGYIPVQAIQNGIYMDTVSNQQAIALCVLDLAKGYEHQSGNYTDGFILKCCELCLQYFPLNVQAMLLKAETLKRIYEKDRQSKATGIDEKYSEMQQLYARIFELGYREMPDKMYFSWLQSMNKEKDKYANKQLQQSLKTKKPGQ